MKIAIASGKGGTGKTTIAVNLSHYLSKSQKEHGFHGVSLVDLDVEEPNSSLFIEDTGSKQEIAYKKIPEWKEASCIFCRKCADACLFNAIAALPNLIVTFPELCHSCYACAGVCPTHAIKMKDARMGVISSSSKTAFHFVEGRMDIGQPSATPLIKQCKESSEKTSPEKYWKIYDCPPGTSCSIIEAVKTCDLVILVTESTPFGLHDLKLALETVKKMQLKHAVIINKYDASYPALDKYLEDEQVAVLGRIPIREELAKAYAAGKLMHESYPKIDAIWENVLQRIKEIIHERNSSIIR